MFKKISILLTLVLISNCGFKVVNFSEVNNFNISEISSSGNTKINYIIKNKIKYLSKNESKNLISLDFNTVKKRTVIEKNIKNEITKYQIEIAVNVELYEIINDKISKFQVSKVGNYNVSKQYSQTLNNEKKTVELLSNEIVNEILEEVNLRINDL